MFQEAHLILQDGTIFSGEHFGYKGSASGEIVFNTSMAGYQEILTDPSYQNQIVVMTYPQIGNTGINLVDVESKKIYLSGFIIKELSPIVSNYRSKKDLATYLSENKIPGIQGIDTRQLVRHIREKGAMPALIMSGPLKNKTKILKQVKELQTMDGQNLAQVVSSKKSYQWVKGVPSVIKHEYFGTKELVPQSKNLKNRKSKKRKKVIAYDFGIKQNILRMLVSHGLDVKVVPHNYKAEDVLKENPDGIFLSNGPGDPAVVKEGIENVKKLIKSGKPLFGICLGHQILGLAMGAKTFKLKFGHHGGNQPVMDLQTRKVEITSQNHGYAIDDKTLPKDVEVSHINLNDKTVEGIRHKKYPVFSVQHHPEASPGPRDSHYLFKRFIELME